MAARITDIRDDNYTIEVDNRCRMCGEVRPGPANPHAVCRACRPRAARQVRAIRAHRRQPAMMPDQVWMSPRVAEALASLPRAFTETRDAPSADLADFLGRVGAFVAGGGE